MSELKLRPPKRAAPIRGGEFGFSYFDFRGYNSAMAEHIEDLQHRFTELKKRVDVVRSFL